MTSILGSAIGRILSKNEGNSAVYLPDGSSIDFAVSIVSAANTEHKSSIDAGNPHFAILVSNEELNLDNNLCKVVTSNESLKYRKNDRLIVLFNSPTELASFDNSTTISMRPEFPENTTGTLSLENISFQLVEEILRASKILSVLPSDRLLFRSVMYQALNALSEIHKLLGGTVKWNVTWIECIEYGTKCLIAKFVELATKNPESRFSDNLDSVWTAFGLPQPRDQEFSTSDIKDIVTALREYWSTSALARTSSMQLAHHPDTKTEFHRLSLVNWDLFDETVSKSRNIFEAFHRHLLDNKNFDDFLQTSIRQFVHPDETQLRVAPPFFRFPNGDPGEFRDSGISVFCASESLEPNRQTESHTPEVELCIPVSTENALSPSIVKSVSVTSTSTEIEWIQKYAKIESDSIILGGYFAEIFPKKNRTIVTKVHKVSVSSLDGTLSKISNLSVPLSVLVFPANTSRLAALAFTKSKLVRTEVEGPSYFNVESLSYEASDEVYTIELSSKITSVVLLARSEQYVPLCNDVNMKPVCLEDGLYFAEVPGASFSEVRFDEELFNIVPAPVKYRIESPIIAASYKELATTDITESVRDSMFGRYEQYVGQQIVSGDWRTYLGHVAIPVSEKFEFSDFFASEKSGVRTTRGLNSKLEIDPDFSVAEEILNSVELSSFFEAFDKLEIADLLRLDAVGSSAVRYISKTSLRALLETKSEYLENYLESYISLVRKARETEHPYTIFWATYPFSMSHWDDESGQLECASILLSPFHPVRLYWSANVEATLWNSEISELMLGSVEGWNFPITGPGTTESSRLLAIPVDSGAGQVFLGWSMMVPIWMGRSSLLEAPPMAGSYEMPGSSAGGLNGAVTKSALRTFKRLAPHLSTLVVDLQSSTKSSRVREIDRALLEVASEWINDEDSPLQGGIRVLDSSQRSGLPPITGLETLISENPNTPVSWQRYEHGNKPAVQDANVRLMNDSASVLAYNMSRDENLGVIGRVPLKRFSAEPSPKPGLAVTTIRPLSGSTKSTSAFIDAISVIESDSVGFALKCKLSTELWADNNAEWTVTGEAFLSPSTISAMLQGPGRGDLMLWEWRPPFLGQKASEQKSLENRPFISLSRVSKVLRRDIQEILERATNAASSAAEVESVFLELGTKGIGLSTLLAIGGNQAIGAIGFYLTLKLSKALADIEDPVFILPLDACDNFLSLLAGTDRKSESYRRADLLAIKISGQSIVLSPIEIKCYGLTPGAAMSRIPRFGDQALNDAFEQVHATQKQIASLCDRWQSVRTSDNDADKAIWTSGFASLIEAASKMQFLDETKAVLVRDSLDNIVNGQCEIVQGRGLVAYYAYLKNPTDRNINSSSPKVSDDYILEMDQDEGLGLLAASTRYALDSVNIDGNELGANWCKLIRWALSRNEDQESASPNSPEGPSGDTLTPAEPKGQHLEAEKKNLESTPPIFSKNDDVGGQPESSSQPSPSELCLEENDGVKIEVGTLLDSMSQAKALFTPGDTRLNQMNIGVVGDLGTGKTQILRTLVAGIREESARTQAEPTTFLIFDYKNDYQDAEFLQRVNGIVLEPENMPLNVFARSQRTSSNPRRQAMEFFDVISRIYKSVGAVQRQRFSSAALAAFKLNEDRPPLLSQVLNEYESLGKPDSVSSILSDFVHGNVFTDVSSETISFDELMKNSVVVVNIHGLGADQAMKNAIVVLFLNLYYDYMKNSVKIPPRKGKSLAEVRNIRSYLLVDEANNIMKYNFDVLHQMMLESREFGFGVILSSQFLSHFTTSAVNYTEPLNSWFIHKIPDVTVRQLVQLGLPDASQETVKRIQTQDNLCSYYSSYGYRGRFIANSAYYKYYSIDD